MLRIKEVRKARGMTQAQVAQRLGLDLTNYNRLENGKTELTVSRMGQLGEILHCEPSEFLAPPQPVQNDNVRVVTVKQHVQAGQWAENLEWDRSDWYEVAVPADKAFAGLALYGAETKGPSMNKRYNEGSSLIYTNVIETGEAIVPGRRYIVETERPDGLREATVKMLWQDEAGEMWLLPESNDPRFSQPIPLRDAEHHIVRIVGRVVYSVQRED
jgi:transcriptional regulator with XRE-family HTH domain